MLRPVIAGECALEFQCLRSFSPPPETTFQNFVESSAFVFVVLRPCGKRFALGLRSEEHTSELQSRLHLVCRLLLEKKKKNTQQIMTLPQKLPRHHITTHIHSATTHPCQNPISKSPTHAHD